MIHTPQRGLMNRLLNLLVVALGLFMASAGVGHSASLTTAFAGVAATLLLSKPSMFMAAAAITWRVIR